MTKIFGFLILFLCGVFFHLSLATAQETLPLHRGLNLSSWLANAKRQPFFARDFAQIKEAGFDHVRLPFDPEYYGFKFSSKSGNADQIDFIALDRAIALAEQYDLPIILDIHPGDDFMKTLERHSWAENEFVDLWKVLAERYKSHPSSVLIFEILNEPQYYKTENLWNKLASRTRNAIRKISPDRVIVIDAPHGADVEALNFLQPEFDQHIIYAFHFYEPTLVTHQGIHIGFEDKMIRYFRSLPYPSSLATKTASFYAPSAPHQAQAQQELQDYIDAPWDAAHIASRIKIAKDWSDHYHVRLLCGEFGVLRNHIDSMSRYRWVNDTRSALDANAIGWELYDYSDIFGITTLTGATHTDPVDGAITLDDPDQGRRVFEPRALAALGMTSEIR
jgi:endoglucanase